MLAVDCRQSADTLGAMKLKHVIVLLSLAACSAGTAEPGLTIVGRIAIDDVDEASGLARSQRVPDVFWVHNDDGKARIYAIGDAGQRVGRLSLDDAENRDWEDISSFVLDDAPYLLVADVGDNLRRRESVYLYIVEEPDLADDDKVREEPAWTIELRYPDGPRDVEAVAVDVDNERVLLLSKRNLPPQLYSVPLRPSEDIVTATKLGAIRSLPPPRRSDVAAAPKTKDWHWQPTAMDILGDTAIVMTYRALYTYTREADEDWFDALNRPPLRTSLGGIPNAEAAAISHDRSSAYVTIENRKPPLYRTPLSKKDLP